MNRPNKNNKTKQSKAKQRVSIKMPTNKYFGLSLAERLSKAGTTTQFSQAVKSGDIKTMTALLLAIDYSAVSAQATAETLINDPNAFEK